MKHSVKSTKHVIFALAIAMALPSASYAAGIAVARPTGLTPSSGFGGSSRGPIGFSQPGALTTRTKEAVPFRLIPRPIQTGLSPQAKVAIEKRFSPKFAKATFIREAIVESGAAAPVEGSHGAFAPAASSSSREQAAVPMERIIQNLTPTVVDAEGKPVADKPSPEHLAQVKAFQADIATTYDKLLNADGKAAVNQLADVVAQGKLYLIGKGERPEIFGEMTKEEINAFVAELEALIVDSFQTKIAKGQLKDGKEIVLNKELFSQEMADLAQALLPAGKKLNSQDVASIIGMKTLQLKLKENGALTKSHVKDVMAWVKKQTKMDDEAARKFCMNCMGEVPQALGCGI